MAEAFFRSITRVPDVLSDKAIVLGEIIDEVTWSTLILTLILAYFALRTLLWQWRLGDYNQRYVLVTGCDTGFGFELVKRLDDLGFRVFAGCLTSEGTERVTNVTTRRVMPLSLDVTDNDNIRHVVEYITCKLPSGSGLWAVVNNAGIMPAMAPLELTPRDCFERTLAVNLMGAVEVTRACLPLVRQSRGRIINMSSVSGRLAFTSIDYTVSKFALEGFSDCLRREVYTSGVQVSTIAPGGFQTSLCDFDKIFNHMQHAFNRLSPHVQQYYGSDYVTSRKRMFDCVFRYIGWGSNSIEQVVEVYVHALSARYPRTRYVVGLDAMLFFHLLCYLPDWLADCLFTSWPFCLVLR